MMGCRKRCAIVAIVFFSFLFNQAYAQLPERKTYVSAGMGPSLKLNGYNNPWCNQPFFEVGIELGNDLGIVGTWVGGNYRFQEEDFYFNGTQWSPVEVQSQINYGFWSLGPLYIIRLDRRSSIDLKARVGRYRYQDWTEGTNVSIHNEMRSIGYYISGTYQFRWRPSWTLLLSLDYATNRPDFNFESYGSMSTLSLSAGIGFRL